MSKFYVYGHYTKDTNELFYIGKGSNKRAWKKSSRNKYWKNIVDKHGLRVDVLVKNLTEESAFIQEILAIKELKPKANLTPKRARKLILWIDNNLVLSANDISKFLKSHPQLITQAAREGVKHKKMRFKYV